MTATLTARAAARTHVGLVRLRNEDAFHVGPRLFAVADGLGGHAGGDIASSLVIEALAFTESRSSTDEDPIRTLGRAVDEAGNTIRRRVRAQPELTGMGSTLDAVLFAGGAVALAHIGDSRAYLLRDGQLQHLTEDHNVGHLVSGADEVPNLAERITRFVDGRPDGRSPDLRLLQLEHGDRILLCTDGLSSYVPENQIAPVLSGNGLDEVAEHLIRLAIDDGGRDNVTVVVIDVRMGA